MRALVTENWVWWLLVCAQTLLLMGIYQLEPRKAISLSAYIGSAYLVLTLLPAHLVRFLPINWKQYGALLLRYRRQLGITTAFAFITHAFTAITHYQGQNPRFLLAFPIVTGVVALIVFELLLYTSNTLAIQKLKQNWKKLHRLVWFALPLALAHSLVSSQLFGGEVSKVGLLVLGGLCLFPLGMYVVLQWQHRQNPTLSKPDFRYLKLVALAGIVLFLLRLSTNLYPY